MDEKILLLLELIIEYLGNQNAAGEYDGNDPRLLNTLAADKIIRLAQEVQQHEQMRIWKI